MKNCGISMILIGFEFKSILLNLKTKTDVGITFKTVTQKTVQDNSPWLYKKRVGQGNAEGKKTLQESTDYNRTNR